MLILMLLNTYLSLLRNILKHKGLILIRYSH